VLCHEFLLVWILGQSTQLSFDRWNGKGRPSAAALRNVPSKRLVRGRPRALTLNTHLQPSNESQVGKLFGGKVEQSIFGVALEVVEAIAERQHGSMDERVGRLKLAADFGDSGGFRSR
jgi:hypothetical protein